MKFCICIVEDQHINAELLSSIVGNFFRKKYVDYELKHYSTGIEFFEDFKEGLINPDLLLMDIFLPRSNGLDLCRQMRKMNYAGTIIITTETKHHAFESFDVDARGYFLKPYDVNRVNDTLEYLFKYSGMRTYVIKFKNRITRIPISDIVFIESHGNTCTIHCEDSVIYTFYKKLDDVEEEINDRHFLRCAQSYLVNMDYIVSAGTEFCMKTGEAIPITRKTFKSLKEKYLNYLKEEAYERT